MSGFRKGKAAIPAKTPPKWARKYPKGITPLRAKMPVRHTPSAVAASMVDFKAKTGPGGKRNRARRRALGGAL